MKRRLLLGASTAAVLGTATGSTQVRRETFGVKIRWLGNNAWEITFGATTILIDPWLTRFQTGTYSPEGIRLDTRLTVDPGKIDQYVSKANVILVCHGHYDHLTDVPYIATKTGASVLGTESHHNMLRALDAPAAQLCTVRGGEYLQYEGFTIEVFESLHSMVGKHKQTPIPGTRPGAVPPRPQTVADLVEGGTLAYQITIGERFRILALSTANFVESALDGLRPDLAFVPVGGATLHDYVGRLMRALGHPPWVVPTHWDDFDKPLTEPAVDFGGLRPLRDAVAKASPRSRFVVVDHLQTFAL